MIRLTDLETGDRIPTRTEAIEAERKRADELAAEVERLKKQLGRS
jgi:hypothetical protein